MRFILYPILLCLGFTANGQAQRFSEMGFSGGVVFPHVMKEKSMTTSIMSGGTGAVNVHLNYENRAPIYFTLGMGIGLTHFLTHEKINTNDNNLDRTITFFTVQVSPGVQYKKPISDKLSWRLGLEVSGAVDITGNFPERNALLIPRLYTGLMTGDIFSFGISYAKPINGYTTFDVEEGYFGNTYGVHTVSFDFRFNMTELKKEGQEARRRWREEWQSRNTWE